MFNDSPVVVPPHTHTLPASPSPGDSPYSPQGSQCLAGGLSIVPKIHIVKVKVAVLQRAQDTGSIPVAATHVGSGHNVPCLDGRELCLGDGMGQGG